jgi:hypothetical protein
MAHFDAGALKSVPPLLAVSELEIWHDGRKFQISALLTRPVCAPASTRKLFSS